MGKLIEHINNNLDIREEWEFIFGTVMPESKFFCPFHDNHNTPSAKRYGNGIKCFGKCQRFYTVYDFLKRFNPQRIEEIKSTVVASSINESGHHRIKLVPIDRKGSISSAIKTILSCQEQ